MRRTDKWNFPSLSLSLSNTHTHTHTHKPVCEHEDDTVIWNQGVNTDREVNTNRPDIIIKNKTKRHTDR